jgi:CheY-like chemotaxis protein
MPGLTGHEVARAIRADGGLPDILLVALTGWGTPEDRDRAHEAGFDRHLTKPAHLSAVDEILRSAALQSASSVK